jgi:hypothetical protein
MKSSLLSMSFFLVSTLVAIPVVANANCSGAKFQAAYALITSDVVADQILGIVDSSKGQLSSSTELCLMIGQYDGYIHEAWDFAYMSKDKNFQDSLELSGPNSTLAFCGLGDDNSLSHDPKMIDLAISSAIKQRQTKMMEVVNKFCPGQFITKQ